MRRTKNEIFLDILKFLTLNNSLRATHLSQKTNLNYVRLKLYLKFGIKKLMLDKKGYFYTITPLGSLLYKKYEEAQLLNKDLENFFKKREGTVTPRS